MPFRQLRLRVEQVDVARPPIMKRKITALALGAKWGGRVAGSAPRRDCSAQAAEPGSGSPNEGVLAATIIRREPTSLAVEEDMGEVGQRRIPATFFLLPRRHEAGCFAGSLGMRRS